MRKLLPFAQTHRYELVAFFSSCAVLIMEIAGARLLAPYFGTSTYVWTAMIGVIVASLSFGYWYGGRLADKDSPEEFITYCLTIAAVCVLAIGLLHTTILSLLARFSLDLRLGAMLAALLLFSVPSMLLGLLSPHLAKIRLNSLKTSGATIGRLEASSALGSITGTFLAGYYLLAYFGSYDITIGVSLLLIATSFLLPLTKKSSPLLRLAIGFATVVLLFTSPTTSAAIIHDKDSTFARYQVEQTVYRGEKVHFLRMDGEAVQSAYFPDSPTKPVLDYTQKIITSIDTLQTCSELLVIGGGAHTIPTHINQRYPEMNITVVEIDQALDSIAQDYFGYTPTPAITILYEDGRTFLNKNSEQYACAVIDAYSSLTPPFHLSTIQAAQKMKHALTDDGVVIANIASKGNRQLVDSLAKTYREVFPHILVVRANPELPTDSSQNYLLLAANDAASLEKIGSGMDVYTPDYAAGIVLTDSYAPVERLSY